MAEPRPPVFGRPQKGEGQPAVLHALAEIDCCRGDFQEMSVGAFSELTYWSARAMKKLGRQAAARDLCKALLAEARQLTTAKFLEAQARLGLGELAAARRLLRDVLRRDPSQALAADLFREFKP